MTHEALDLVEADGSAAVRLERAFEKRRCTLPRRQGGLCSGQVEHVEAPRRAGDQRAGHEIAAVEGLEWVRHHDGVAGAPGGRSHRVVDDVEQLADGHGGRAVEVGALVTARVGDDEVVARRQQRVEEELAILAAHIAVAHPWGARRQIVAVALHVAGEAAVIEARGGTRPGAGWIASARACTR